MTSWEMTKNRRHSESTTPSIFCTPLFLATVAQTPVSLAGLPGVSSFPGWCMHVRLACAIALMWVRRAQLGILGMLCFLWFWLPASEKPRECSAIVPRKVCPLATGGLTVVAANVVVRGCIRSLAWNHRCACDVILASPPTIKGHPLENRFSACCGVCCIVLRALYRLVSGWFLLGRVCACG